MTRADERNIQIIEEFIATIVSTGRTREEAEDMINRKALTVTDMEGSLGLINQVLGLGTQLMRSRRRPVSERDLYLNSLFSDVVASNPEVVRKPGGSLDRRG